MPRRERLWQWVPPWQRHGDNPWTILRITPVTATQARGKMETLVFPWYAAAILWAITRCISAATANALRSHTAPRIGPLMRKAVYGQHVIWPVKTLVYSTCKMRSPVRHNSSNIHWLLL